jgi:hypothetical protein
VATVGLREQGRSRSHELLALARPAMARDGPVASTTRQPWRRPAVGWLQPLLWPRKRRDMVEDEERSGGAERVARRGGGADQPHTSPSQGLLRCGVFWCPLEPPRVVFVAVKFNYF